MKTEKNSKLKFGCSPLMKEAIYFAAENHDGQYRKGTRVPFFVHPIIVALCVMKYTNDENIVVAAILHDTIEDCPNVTKKRLSKLFGNEVAQIVSELSRDEKNHKNKKTWKENKMAYISKIKKASKEALIIVASDKINNMNSYFGAIQSSNTKSLSKDFGGSIQDYFWYYKEILLILKSKLGKHPIVKDYDKILKHHKLTLA